MCAHAVSYTRIRTRTHRRISELKRTFAPSPYNLSLQWSCRHSSNAVSVRKGGACRVRAGKEPCGGCSVTQTARGSASCTRTRTHTHTRTRTRTRTHTHTHARARAHTPTRTHRSTQAHVRMNPHVPTLEQLPALYPFAVRSKQARPHMTSKKGTNAHTHSLHRSPNTRSLSAVVLPTLQQCGFCPKAGACRVRAGKEPWGVFCNTDSERECITYTAYCEWATTGQALPVAVCVC